MLRRTPAHHFHTAGLLPAALKQQLPHMGPPSIPTATDRHVAQEAKPPADSGVQRRSFSFYKLLGLHIGFSHMLCKA